MMARIHREGASEASRMQMLTMCKKGDVEEEAGGVVVVVGGRACEETGR